MRLKRDGRCPRSLRPRYLHHAAQQRLVGLMDTIEVADGHHAGGPRFAEFLKCIDHAHTRSETRKAKLETRNSELGTRYYTPASNFQFRASAVLPLRIPTSTHHKLIARARGGWRWLPRGRVRGQCG